MSDEFEDIVNNNDDGKEDKPEFERLIEVVAHYWKKFYPGQHFARGMIVAEVLYTDPKDGESKFALCSEISDMTPAWGVLGMLESMKQSYSVDSVLGTFIDTSPTEEQESEDDDTTE